MKFTFTCKKVSLNDSIKEYAEKKISKLDRYFREDADALVTFSVEKSHRCVVEVTIVSGGTLFRAQEESRDGDMRGAIDAAAAPSACVRTPSRPSFLRSSTSARRLISRWSAPSTSSPSP